MIETVLVSAMVSVVTSRLMAFYYLHRLDKYADDLMEMVKGFLNDLFTTLSKREQCHSTTMSIDGEELARKVIDIINKSMSGGKPHLMI